MGGGRWIRDLPVQIAVAIVVLLLGLLGAESLARWRFPQLKEAPQRQSRPEDLFMRFDSRLGWSHVPGRKVRFRRTDFDVHVTINDDGFRGPRVPLPRTPGRPRILFLGDSYAFGHGVEDDETAAAQLERLLPGCEVVNLGVTGYSTDQELLLLRERGLAYRPDVVVLMICGNDLLDNGKQTAWGVYWKPRFLLRGDSLVLEREVPAQRAPFKMRLARELNRRFVLYELVSWKLARWRIAKGSGGPASAAAGRSEELMLTRRLVEEVCRCVSEHDGQVLLTVIPPFDAPEILTDLPPAGAGARLDLEPILNAYQATHPDSTIQFRHDTHWDARGHRLVARAIAEAIRSHGWIARLPSAASL